MTTGRINQITIFHQAPSQIPKRTRSKPQRCAGTRHGQSCFEFNLAILSMKNSCAFRNRKCVRKPNSVPRQEAPQAQTTVCHLFTIFSGQLTKSAPALNQSIETGPFSECPDVERSAPVDCTARIASAVVPRDGCFRVLGSLLLLRRAKRHKSSGASGPSVAVTLVPSVGLIGQKLDPSPRQCVATFSRVAERAAPSRRGSHAASCFWGAPSSRSSQGCKGLASSPAGPPGLAKSKSASGRLDCGRFRNCFCGNAYVHPPGLSPTTRATCLFSPRRSTRFRSRS